MVEDKNVTREEVNQALDMLFEIACDSTDSKRRSLMMECKLVAVERGTVWHAEKMYLSKSIVGETVYLFCDSVHAYTATDVWWGTPTCKKCLARLKALRNHCINA